MKSQPDVFWVTKRSSLCGYGFCGTLPSQPHLWYPPLITRGRWVNINEIRSVNRLGIDASERFNSWGLEHKEAISLTHISCLGEQMKRPTDNVLDSFGNRRYNERKTQLHTSLGVTGNTLHSGNTHTVFSEVSSHCHRHLLQQRERVEIPTLKQKWYEATVPYRHKYEANGRHTVAGICVFLAG